MLCSLSPFKARSLIIPFEVFNVVCSETDDDDDDDELEFNDASTLLGY